MRAPLSWLRDFAPFGGDAADLADTLSQLGLVVEALHRVGEGLEEVVAARVLTTSAHPSADRVQLVEVDTGGAIPAQVVCGAFNFGPGDVVPFARPGARLPGGMEIGRRRVRGEWSEGMLCSGAELDLSDDHSGILVLPRGTQPGTPVADVLGVGTDVVFELETTPNRPDALSVTGVARDLAARLGLPFAIPEPPGLADGGDPRVTVVVESPDLCPRFTATRIEGVSVGPSPPRLASRLTLAGMRPINNLVDVSNYVMLELGQPNHPYDLDRLPGEGLLVRRARQGEVLVTLDGVERRLGDDDCLICDAKGTPVGIGGIMGGASSEISPDTSRVLLEAAFFDPLAIARTSKRLALRTEASVRFERGVDPWATARSVARFCQLAADTAGATAAAAPVDVRGRLPAPVTVTVRPGRVNAILGTSLPAEQVVSYLEPLGFECAPTGEGDLRVTVPPWRPDSEREIDVIEEVGRHYGYDRIPRTLPLTAAVGGGLSAYQRDRRRVRQVLVGAGLSEAWATSFLAPDDLVRAGLAPDAVEIENPLAKEESVLRTSLLPGLLRAVAVNHSHRRPEVALFEIGHVFLPPPPGDDRPPEPERLAGVLSGRSATDAKLVWDTLVDALGVEAPTVTPASPPGLHPTRSAVVSAGDIPLGAVGEVDPDVLAAHDLPGPVGWFEVDLGMLLAAPRRPRLYRPVSRYPSADVDLAFAVDEGVPVADVEMTLRAAAGHLLEDLWLFDVFRGRPAPEAKPGPPAQEAKPGPPAPEAKPGRPAPEAKPGPSIGEAGTSAQLGPGRRSLAWRLRFAALDHTLDEEELAAVRARCIEAVEGAFPARLRG